MSAPLPLLALARDNKAEELRRLVNEGGLHPDAANEFGQTALHVAALWGNINAVKVLLELGADVNVTNSRGTTPLHFAAAAKKDAMGTCRALLDAGADQEAVDLNGRQPYEMANEEDVRSLLGGPDTRIFEAATRGDAAALRGLIEDAAKAAAAAGGGAKPLSLRVVDSEGNTPLGLAIAAESLETVKVMLDHDPAMVNYPDMSGSTPLHAAVEAGNLDVVRHLLACSSPPAELNVQKMHESEYAQGNWMLAGNAIEPFDATPLHMAVEAGDVELVKLLLGTGRCSVNLLNFDRASPLHLALEAGDEDIARALLAAGADPDLPNPDFKSPLHLAASRGKMSLLRLLLEDGKASVAKAVSEDGWTPLQLAARGGAADKVDALLKAGANPGAANNQGNTALHLAAVNGHTPVAHLLLGSGAPKDAANSEGKRPADVAKTPELKALLS